MFELARGYKERGMAAYSELQQAEFAAEKHGYSATRHQREVGTGYFDEVAQVITGGTSSTTALKGSTEEAQFTNRKGHLLKWCPLLFLNDARVNENISTIFRYIYRNLKYINDFSNISTI